MTLRLVAYGLMVALVLGSVTLLTVGLRTPRIPAAVQTSAPVQARPAATVAGRPATPTVSPAAEGIQIEDQTAGTPAVSTRMPTHLRPAEELLAGDVAEITGSAGQQVLVFRDGTRLPVTPDVRARLSGDLQLRLSYTRAP